MSLKFLDLIHSTSTFLLLTFEFLSTYLILHFQKKHKKRLINNNDEFLFYLYTFIKNLYCP